MQIFIRINSGLSKLLLPVAIHFVLGIPNTHDAWYSLLREFVILLGIWGIAGSGNHLYVQPPQWAEIIASTVNIPVHPVQFQKVLHLWLMSTED